MCPASFAQAQQTSACKPVGLACAYPEGQCNCSYGPLPNPGGTPGWLCAAPSPDCPEPRPRLGDLCTMDGLVCDYGACYGGVAEQCDSGIWFQTFTPCPASAAP